MIYRMRQAFEESKIVNFFKGFNANMLTYFYDSHTYKFFKNLNIFFKGVILKNAGNSLIVKSVKGICGYIKLKDIGIFIVLVALFNTAWMLMLKRVIDIFSVLGRGLSILLGSVMIWKDAKR